MKLERLKELAGMQLNEATKMTVADTIKLLEATVAKLKKMDPNIEVVGHVQYPAGGYSGDLDDPIVELDIEHDEGKVVIGVHY